MISSDWNLDQAVSLYLAAEDQSDPENTDRDVRGGEPSTVEASSSQPAATSSTRPKGNRRPKQMTLQDLQRNSDDGDTDEDGKLQDMFAGGEKSGLAVQNPNQGGSDGSADHFKNILNQAKANHERPDADTEDEEPSGHNHFQGRAQTLGGEDTESRVIEDPQATARQRQKLPKINRTLHLWADGVSIDDGPLFRFDDPANEGIMAQINQGRAPLSLLDVQPDQEVDLNLVPHRGENYVTPKKTYKPFSGQGQRLGSPTPALASSSARASTAAAAKASESSTSTASEVGIDENVPTITLQIRLGDGTRMQSRFNTTHTIGTVYDFVDRASVASTQRPYVLMTTFPSKEFNDKALLLGDISDFKRGGVVVQKWK